MIILYCTCVYCIVGRFIRTKLCSPAAFFVFSCLHYVTPNFCARKINFLLGLSFKSCLMGCFRFVFRFGMTLRRSFIPAGTLMPRRRISSPGTCVSSAESSWWQQRGWEVLPARRVRSYRVITYSTPAASARGSSGSRHAPRAGWR